MILCLTSTLFSYATLCLFNYALAFRMILSTSMGRQRTRLAGVLAFCFPHDHHHHQSSPPLLSGDKEKTIYLEIPLASRLHPLSGGHFVFVLLYKLAWDFWSGILDLDLGIGRGGGWGDVCMHLFCT